MSYITALEPETDLVRGARMARSIAIPGDDLQQAADSMRRILQHLTVKPSKADFTRAVGAPVRDAANHFDDRWDAGRKQLRRECEDIVEAIDMILSAFVSVDDRSGANLDGGR
ncbi:hypothetical protein [Actinoplanes sp. NPDC049316]|uniref:hypothetical protein n=1 Tax=Actinoplanes sp. NPDC049316 TaxID=3154727 RepID=UPI00341F2EDF